MAKIKRHVFSQNELSQLQETLDNTVSEVESVKQRLGHLRRVKISLQQKHADAHQKYR